MILRILQRLPAPVTFVIVMVSMAPLGLVIGIAQLVQGVLHRPPAATPRWSDEAQRRFWADHRNGFLSGAQTPSPQATQDHVDGAPEDEWGEAIIGTRDRRLCQAADVSAHYHSNRWTRYRGLAGLPKAKVRLECSCGTACSSEHATCLARMGSSMSAGPALLLCRAHTDWFEANRLLGGGAGGITAGVDATGLWG